MSARIEGLRAAVAVSPDNHALRLVLAEALRDAGEEYAALDELETLHEAGALPEEELVATGHLALEYGRVPLAARLLDAARAAGLDAAELERDLRDTLADDVQADAVAPPQPEERITFADVGGLEEVKQAIHRTIVMPYQQPELYARYGRRAGGGVLLYGPPGCGKTLLARATAGECGVPFFNIRIEDVLDPTYGMSEQRLHHAFEVARRAAPCVLFLDEIDALAYARRKQQGAAGRALVDQLLQELDAIGSDNEGVLILAATNAPWDVDDALKRPGRFDRVVFVSPPDTPARRRVLELGLHGRPTAAIDVAQLADRTPLFSGADLRAVVERATDAAIDDALARGAEVPIGPGHLDRALGELRPTTVDWLRTARNYVEFANEGGRYDDVLAYLAARDVKAAVKRR